MEYKPSEHADHSRLLVTQFIDNPLGEKRAQSGSEIEEDEHRRNLRGCTEYYLAIIDGGSSGTVKGNETKCVMQQEADQRRIDGNCLRHIRKRRRFCAGLHRVVPLVMK